MTNISEIARKHAEKLKGQSDSEKALFAARKSMEEVRRNRHIQDPDQLASGKANEYNA